jgi:hypothetical protein
MINQSFSEENAFQNNQYQHSQNQNKETIDQ